MLVHARPRAGFRLLAIVFVFTPAVAFMTAGTCLAQENKTSRYVKVTATAGKPNDAGKQVLTVLLEIEKPCFLFANPVANEIFEGSETRLIIKIAGKAASAKINYPEGTIEEEKSIGRYKVYKGKVTIVATVERAKGDATPLDIEVRMHGTLVGAGY